MARRGRRRSKKKKPGPLLIGGRGRFTLRLDSVEITRGHDGFLRGDPEPTLILAAFAVARGNTYLLERTLRRLRATAPFPSEVTVGERLLFSADLPGAPPRVALLGLAVEQDHGKDVEALYAALGHAESLDTWSISTPLPEPRGIEDLVDEPPTRPPVATRVHLMRDGVDMGDACRHDNWIGAALLLLATDQPCVRRWRMPFLSADGRNDWTVRLRLGA